MGATSGPPRLARTTIVPIGHGDLEVAAVRAVPVRALAVLAAIGFELGMEAEIDEGVEVGAGHHVDRAAMPAIPAVGSAAGDELLAPEAQSAASAVTRRDLDVDFVNEHDGMEPGA